MALIIISIKTGRSHDDRIYDGEDAFTSDIFAGDTFQFAVRQNGGLVQVHAPPVDRASERHLVGVEVLETRSPNNILRTVPKYVGNRVRCKKKPGIFIQKICQ